MKYWLHCQIWEWNCSPDCIQASNDVKLIEAEGLARALNNALINVLQCRWIASFCPSWPSYKAVAPRSQGWPWCLHVQDQVSSLDNVDGAIFENKMTNFLPSIKLLIPFYFSLWIWFPFWIQTSYFGWYGIIPGFIGARTKRGDTQNGTLYDRAKAKPWILIYRFLINTRLMALTWFRQTHVCWHLMVG